MSSAPITRRLLQLPWTLAPPYSPFPDLSFLPTQPTPYHQLLICDISMANYNQSHFFPNGTGSAFYQDLSLHYPTTSQGPPLPCFDVHDTPSRSQHRTPRIFSQTSSNPIPAPFPSRNVPSSPAYNPFFHRGINVRDSHPSNNLMPPPAQRLFSAHNPSLQMELAIHTPPLAAPNHYPSGLGSVGHLGIHGHTSHIQAHPIARLPRCQIPIYPPVNVGSPLQGGKHKYEGRTTGKDKDKIDMINTDASTLKEKKTAPKTNRLDPASRSNKSSSKNVQPNKSRENKQGLSIVRPPSY